MRRRTIFVNLDGFNSSVRGWGSRELLESVTGRAPVYRPAVKAWGAQESTCRDVVAAAERANFDLVITGPRASRDAGIRDRTPATGVTPGNTSQTPAPEPEGEAGEVEQVWLW